MENDINYVQLGREIISGKRNLRLRLYNLLMFIACILLVCFLKNFEFLSSESFLYFIVVPIIDFILIEFTISLMQKFSTKINDLEELSGYLSFKNKIIKIMILLVPLSIIILLFLIHPEVLSMYNF